MGWEEWERLVGKQLTEHEVQKLTDVYYAVGNEMSVQDIADLFKNKRHIFDMLWANIDKVRMVKDAECRVRQAAGELRLELDHMKETKYLTRAGARVYNRIAQLASELEDMIEEMIAQRDAVELLDIWDKEKERASRKEAKKNGDN